MRLADTLDLFGPQCQAIHGTDIVSHLQGYLTRKEAARAPGEQVGNAMGPPPVEQLRMPADLNECAGYFYLIVVLSALVGGLTYAAIWEPETVPLPLAAAPGVAVVVGLVPVWLIWKVAAYVVAGRVLDFREDRLCFARPSFAGRPIEIP